MREYPQFEDLGLVDDDHTEVLTRRKAPAAAEALQKNTHHRITSRKEVRHEV